MSSERHWSHGAGKDRKHDEDLKSDIHTEPGLFDERKVKRLKIVLHININRKKSNYD
jgi:hypothetical protein